MGGGGPFEPRTKHELQTIPFYVDWGLALASGITSAVCAAPFIMIVDKAVTENSAGKISLGKALAHELRQFLTRPHRTLTSLPFWMVAGVYGSTYATANSIDVACERTLIDRDEQEAKKKARAERFNKPPVSAEEQARRDARIGRFAEPPAAPTAE